MEDCTETFNEFFDNGKRTFETFAEFADLFEKYQKETTSVFSIASSSTIAAHNRQMVSRNKNVHYSEEVCKKLIYRTRNYKCRILTKDDEK